MTEPPERTALYRLYDADGSLLYVGVTRDPKRRFRDHRGKKRWWGEVSSHSIEWVDIESHALQMEVQAIVMESPKYNVRSTEAYKAQQSETAKAVSPEGRRARGVGVAGRALQVRTLRALKARGVPSPEAERQALLARQRHKEASES
ncbi:GIY-YIG nuclease family protein [Streptomyces brevispora]|uniref:GIY-YIG nuclease family protein n=1 Tax=Streptomyces brevispora TaxID=887462 RepID=UPI002E36FE51|nr:GIY-YIG nuclease family protein [Streptomyces brevispora]